MSLIYPDGRERCGFCGLWVYPENEAYDSSDIEGLEDDYGMDHELICGCCAEKFEAQGRRNYHREEAAKNEEYKRRWHIA